MIVTNKDLNLAREQKKNPERMEISNIAGYQSVDLKWIVKGDNRYTIRVESVKGGRTTVVVE
jgi:hypothetical protein